MNDDFLQRLRKAPPPQFLDRLKAKLDRQPLLPTPPRPRRFAFSRGMIVGFVLGGAAIAIGVTSVPGVSDSLLPLLQAPGKFVARHWLYGPSVADSNQHKAVPLGPVWLPEHPGQPSKPTIPTASASFEAPAGDHSHQNNAANGTASVGGDPLTRSLLVIASKTAFGHATFVSRGTGSVKVELDTGAPALERLCGLSAGTANTAYPPAAIVLSQRIPAEEPRNCSAILKALEMRIGYEALVLGRAKLYGPLRLTRRALFLALAKRIPDPNPNRAGTLIDNPNTTWNQVDPGIPYERDRIQVFGPPPDSESGKLAARLMLEAGCNTYPWITALRDRDPDRYEQICTTLRDDGVYTQAAVSGWAYADELVGNPTAVGVFSTNEFASVKDRLSASPLDGIEPSGASLASGSYPASWTLYLYTTKARLRYNQELYAFVRSSIVRPSTNDTDPDGWGFTQLDPDEQAATLKAAHEEFLN